MTEGCYLERKREREKRRKREKSTYILKQMLFDLFQPCGQAPVKEKKMKWQKNEI